MTDDLHHLAAAYALDALDEVERRRFEAHYPSSEITADEVADFRRVAATLAAAESTPPPTDLRDRVLAQIAATPQLPPRLDRSEPAPTPIVRRALLATAAAVVLLAGVLVIPRLGGNATTDDVVSAPDAAVAVLASDTEAGSLTIVWSDEQDQVAIIGTELEAIDADSAYALWFLLEDGVAPAALFTPRPDGTISTVIDVDDAGDLTIGAPVGWGITVEPAEGSPAPTTPVLFSGSL
ncbi:MAG: anti-sigma factor [Actinomycetota bacterium]